MIIKFFHFFFSFSIIFCPFSCSFFFFLHLFHPIKHYYDGDDDDERLLVEVFIQHLFSFFIGPVFIIPFQSKWIIIFFYYHFWFDLILQNDFFVQLSRLHKFLRKNIDDSCRFESKPMVTMLKNTNKQTNAIPSNKQTRINK